MPATTVMTKCPARWCHRAWLAPRVGVADQPADTKARQGAHGNQRQAAPAVGPAGSLPCQHAAQVDDQPDTSPMAGEYTSCTSHGPWPPGSGQRDGAAEQRGQQAVAQQGAEFDGCHLAGGLARDCCASAVASVGLLALAARRAALQQLAVERATSASQTAAPWISSPAPAQRRKGGPALGVARSHQGQETG